MSKLFIGNARRMLFIEGTSEWNGVVRDLTAKLEVEEHVDSVKLLEAIGDYMRSKAFADGLKEAVTNTTVIPSVRRATGRVDPERLTQMIAHRACCGVEADSLNGKIHGYCLVCGVPWPCEYVGPLPSPPAQEEPKK